MAAKIYYKITNKTEFCEEFQYRDGLNVYGPSFNNNQKYDGLYFTDIDHIFSFLDEGVYLREVMLPTHDDFKMIKYANKYKANMIILGKRYDLDLDTIKMLVDRGRALGILLFFPLKWSIRHNHVDITKYIFETLDGRINLDYDDKKILSQNLSMVKYCMEKGTNMYDVFYDILVTCIKSGDFEMIKYISEYKRSGEHNAMYSIDLRDILWNRSKDLLPLFTGEQHYDILKYLEYRLNIRAKDDIILRQNAANGNLKIVEYLVKHGANIHAVDDEALKLSAKNGHLHVVDLLVKNGANVHADKEAALINSSENGHTKIVKYLIDWGADISAISIDTINVCVQKNYLDIVKYIADHRLDFDKIITQNTLNILVKNKHWDMIKYLVTKGVNIGPYKNSILAMNAGDYNWDMVIYIIEKGADIHLQSDYALRIALVTNNLSMVQRLVDMGADVHATKYYVKYYYATTPLQDKYMAKITRYFKTNKISSEKSLVNIMMATINSHRSEIEAYRYLHELLQTRPNRNGLAKLIKSIIH